MDTHGVGVLSFQNTPFVRVHVQLMAALNSVLAVSPLFCGVFIAIEMAFDLTGVQALT